MADPAFHARSIARVDCSPPGSAALFMVCRLSACKGFLGDERNVTV